MTTTRLARRTLAMLAAIATISGARGGAATAGDRSGFELEFRSRPGEYFGHDYVIARRLSASGKWIPERRAGLEPEPGASIGDTLMGVRGVVGFVREDWEIAPDERYVVRVARAQYKRALAQIDRNARRRPTYDLFDQNCNSFVGVVARSAGARPPPSGRDLPGLRGGAGVRARAAGGHLLRARGRAGAGRDLRAGAGR